MTAITRDVSILNALGLHARAAARFVQTASRFQAAIRVTRGDRTVDGKSIMGILLLAAARGTTLTIAAEGPMPRPRIERALRARRVGLRGGTLMRRLTGAAIVPGIGIGRAVLLVRRGRALRTRSRRSRWPRKSPASSGHVTRSREQLMAIKDRLSAGPGAELAALFDAQILMLDDPLLMSRAIALVRGGAGERGLGRAARLRRAGRALCRRQRRLPARARRRRR